MKILFVIEKYIFYDQPQFGLTNTIHNLVGSWEASYLGDYEIAFISPNDIWTAAGVDKVLTERDYDLAVISPYQGPSGCINCSYEVADKIGHKLVFCWWDWVAFPLRGTFVHPETQNPGWCWWEYADRGAHNLIMDSGVGELYKNSYSVAVPQDTRLFCREGIPEDIDVSFIGAFHTRGDRIHVVNMIRNAGFNVWVGGGRGYVQHHDNMTVEDYARIHKRSKICLNLQVGHGKPQRKGRTFELGACGKFMMANNPRVLDGYFEEGIDYVSFDDGDLIKKLKYYLSNASEREWIADNLYDKYTDNYSPVPWWKNVLEMCA